MDVLTHPVLLILVFVIAGLGVAAWWYVRKHRSDSDELPTIPASEITHPSSTPARAGVPSKKHTPREILQRALRRGDKALGTLESSSLPFLDTSPLTHQDHPEQAEIETGEGKQTSNDAPSNRR